MEENNILNNETENEIKPVYVSGITANKDFFRELNTVSFDRVKKLYILSLIVAAFGVIISVITVEPYLAYYSAFLFLLELVSFFGTRAAVNNSYKRALIAAGKEETFEYELFEDKVVSNMEGLKREHLYSGITGLFESEKMLLLHLQKQLYITVDKTTLNADVNEVKAFLLDKCTLVKKKRFKNCANAKNLCIAMMVATGVIVAAGIINVTLLYSYNPFLY